MEEGRLIVEGEGARRADVRVLLYWGQALLSEARHFLLSVPRGRIPGAAALDDAEVAETAREAGRVLGEVLAKRKPRGWRALLGEAARAFREGIRQGVAEAGERYGRG